MKTVSAGIIMKNEILFNISYFTPNGKQEKQKKKTKKR